MSNPRIPRRTSAPKPVSATRRKPRPEQSSDRAAPRVAAKAPAPKGPLTTSQKRYLRGLAHDLKPVILIGHKGVTPAVLGELEIALAHHELIKIKLGDDDRHSRAASVEEIRASSGAEIVQTIGRVACLFRFNPERAQFTLPKK
ncbi:MAG: ribosome assembly RNA-binding protein YhbY [Dokdonella sp.]